MRRMHEHASLQLPAFYVQLFHDAELAEYALKRLRTFYPHSRILLQSDGDTHPYNRALAEVHHCEYAEGERLYLLEHGGRMIQRMLNMYLSGTGEWLIKIDTDTRIDRPFTTLPLEMAVYGTPLRQGPPQGGCVIIPRKVAEAIRDSRVLLSPLLKNPSSSWGAVMAPAFLRERMEATGCIGFEWTLYWACEQLDIPTLSHPEIHATWKQGHINTYGTFAAVHPDKFMNIQSKPVHDLCTINHSDIHTIWLDAVSHAT
jgi:hypothetical protein